MNSHSNTLNSKESNNTTILYSMGKVSKQYPAFHSLVAWPNSNPNAWVPSKEAVCTILMMVLGMNLPGHESKIYRMRGYSSLSGYM